MTHKRKPSRYKAQPPRRNLVWLIKPHQAIGGHPTDTPRDLEYIEYYKRQGFKVVSRAVYVFHLQRQHMEGQRMTNDQIREVQRKHDIQQARIWRGEVTEDTMKIEEMLDYNPGLRGWSLPIIRRNKPR